MARKPTPVAKFKNDGQRRLVGLKLTLAAIAKVTGASNQSANEWKRGKKIPAPTARKKLQEAYSIPYISWLQVPSSEAAAVATPATPELPELPTIPADLSSVAEVEQLLTIVRRLRSTPDLTTEVTLRIIAQESSLLAARERIIERQELLEDRVVREHPEWRRLRDLILATLTKHPKAARDVARVLRGT